MASQSWRSSRGEAVLVKMTGVSIDYMQLDLPEGWCYYGTSSSFSEVNNMSFIEYLTAYNVLENWRRLALLVITQNNYKQL